MYQGMDHWAITLSKLKGFLPSASVAEPVILTVLLDTVFPAQLPAGVNSISWMVSFCCSDCRVRFSAESLFRYRLIVFSPKYPVGPAKLTCALCIMLFTVAMVMAVTPWGRVLVKVLGNSARARGDQSKSNPVNSTKIVNQGRFVLASFLFCFLQKN